MEIQKEDVLKVAYDLKKNLTEKQIQYVLDNYESSADADPTGTWDLIVEQLIYEQTT